MKTITSIGLALSIFCSPEIGLAVAKVVANYPFKTYKGYIHPIGILSVTEEIGKSNYAYRWKGLYRADPNNPKIKAELKKVGESKYYGLSAAAVSVYDKQVEALGIKVDSRMTGIFSYMVKDRQGRQWQVIVRGDQDFYTSKSGEFSVFRSPPSG